MSDKRAAKKDELRRTYKYVRSGVPMSAVDGLGVQEFECTVCGRRRKGSRQASALAMLHCDGCDRVTTYEKIRS